MRFFLIRFLFFCKVKVMKKNSIKRLKRIPFQISYIIREFFRKYFFMKITYKFPQYSPHVGGKGLKFDKATEFNIQNLVNLISDISTKFKPTQIIKLDELEIKSEFYKEIADIFNKNGSDKSWQGKYEKIYAFIFENLVTDPQKILEIGIGSKNKKYLSYMGKNEKTGASLMSFKKLFPSSIIYGADIDIDTIDIFAKEDIEIHFVDQMNPQSVEGLFNKFDFNFDLIIDDGLHLESSNLLVMIHGLKKLNKNGCMVIEDIGHSAFKTWNIVSNLLNSNFKSYFIQRENLGYCFIIQKI